MSDSMNVRASAAMTLAKVFYEGKSLSHIFAEGIHDSVETADRGLLQELCFGTLRWYPRLEALINRLLRKPLKDKDGDIYCLLMVGLYQLIHTRIPEHAAVSATVAATRDLNKPWASGLVNALLRGFQRQRDQLLRDVDTDTAVARAHPHWLYERIRHAHPSQWSEILEANNHRPPMHLRINARLTSRNEYLLLLQRANIAAHPLPHTACGITLESPMDVEQLPGFAAGLVSVQDGAAQLAAPLLDLQPGQRVLDACAAPGSKSCHILEMQAHLALLVAIDKDAARARRIAENLQRLGLSACTITADASEPEAWWDGKPFDRILLDAPCTATGVIRRHPDIKRLRRAEDIPAMVKTQEKLLESLWPLLRGGGMLVYVTCSILPEENSGQIRHFLQKHRDAREHPFHALWGHDMEIGRQILPGEDDLDGFYYARIEKLP